MVDIHHEAKRTLRQLLCASVLVNPLDQGLTEEELRSAAVLASVSPAVFDEVIYAILNERTESSGERLTFGVCAQDAVCDANPNRMLVGR
jgi:hypothetical protein